MAKFNMTSSKKSSERLALIKLEELLEAVKLLASKLDSDTGLATDDFGELVEDIKSITEELSINPKTAE